MILTELQVEGFRRFTAPVTLAGLKPGLNVLAAPNEAGKSTLLMALRAALTLRHTSKSQPIKDLASYGGSAPHVLVRFTWNGVPCVLEKRFLTKSCMRLTRGPDHYEGDEAEEQLRLMLGLNEAGRGEAAGLWNALLVGQGESFALPALSEAGHASIRSCLSQGIDVVTGGAVASAVLGRVKEQLGLLQTATGRPTGLYKKAMEQEAEAENLLAQLKTRKNRLEEDLVTLAQARRLLQEHANPDRKMQDEAALAALRVERDKATKLEAEEQAARATVNVAQVHSTNLKQEQQSRQENRERIQHLIKSQTAAQEVLNALEPRMQQAQQRVEQARLTREAAEAAHELARKQRALSAQQAGLAQKQQRLGQEQASLRRVEAAYLQLEQAEAVLAALRCVDDASMDRLHKADRVCAQLQAQREAQAPTLTLTLLPEAAGQVTINGAPCKGNSHQLLQETVLQIAGIGTVTISPAQQDQSGLAGKWELADTQRTLLLQQMGCQTMADAATHHARYRQAQTRVTEARATYHASLPHGQAGKEQGAAYLVGLRKAMAEQEAQFALAEQAVAAQQVSGLSQTVVSPDEAAEAEDQAAHQAEAARQAERQAQAAFSSAQTQQQAALVTVREVAQALQQAQREESVYLSHKTDEALAADLTQAREDLAVATARLEQFEQHRAETRPLATLESGIARYEQKLEANRTRISQLQIDIREREAHVRFAEGEGLDEQIAATERTVERLKHDREGYERSRAALALLQQTVSAAEQEQTERYLAPLVKTMQPAFSSLFPGGALTLNTQFGVQAITRRQTEEFSKLSDGTREQIAVLVRLGFAELLQSQTGNSLLVLDDALSFSDSQRLERLFDVLTDAASRFQILVLTCHAESFAALGGNPLSLQPLENFTELR